MSGIFICLFAWVFKDEIRKWVSIAIAEGIKLSKEK
jgi:hypothetical protein